MYSPYDNGASKLGWGSLGTTLVQTTVIVLLLKTALWEIRSCTAQSYEISTFTIFVLYNSQKIIAISGIADWIF